MNRFPSFIALIALHLTCAALPKGAPPPTPIPFGGDYWNCLLPVKIAIRGPSIGYMSTDLTSRVVEQFTEGANVSVLQVLDVVLDPGIAEVTRDDFEHNSLGLSVGVEVYALAEWEFLYFHAWVNGL
ncbi:MAG: hypothetical protein K2X55_17040 [Burkholderiaceae bacterium]|nr:hypothetical protein [Burkholderiaceae bacterium]